MDAQDIGNGMWSWDEEDSAVYRALAEVAVPGREAQLATMLCLLPFGRDEAFRIVDVGCGEGVFARAALTAYPMASVLRLDGSASMREHAEALLEPFGKRAEVRTFELEDVEWLDALDDADCLVSSLALHHMTADGKRDLFAKAFRRLGERAVVVMVDVVLPQRAEAWRLYAHAYDNICRQQSMERTGGDALYAQLVEEKWNYYRYPDDAETPSPLSQQLAWLVEVGFDGVDCFWLQAGHAVFGGYKGGVGTQCDVLSLGDARGVVRAAMDANREIN